MFFERSEHCRIVERVAPTGNRWFRPFPDDPLFVRVFEEEFFVNQAAINDVRDHVPVTQDHAHKRIFLCIGRSELQDIFGRGWLELSNEPITRFAQAGLAPHVVETKHQIYFFVRDFSQFLLRNVLEIIAGAVAVHLAARLYPYG